MDRRYAVKEELQELLTLQQKNIRLKAELNKYMAVVDEYQKNGHNHKVKTLKLENADLMKNLQQKENELNEMKAELNEYAGKAEAFSVQEQYYLETIHLLSEKNQEMKNVKHDIESKQTEIDSLRDHIMTLQNDYDVKNKECIELKQQLSEKMEGEEKSTQTIHSLNHQIIELNSVLENLQSGNEELKEKYEMVRKTAYSVPQLETIVSSLHQELGEMDRHHREMQDSISDLQQKNKLLEAEKRRLLKEKSSMQAVQSELQKKIYQLMIDIRSFYSKERIASHMPNRKLIQTSMAQKKKIQHLQSRVSEYGKQITAGIDMIHQLERQISQLTADMQLPDGENPDTSPNKKFR
ncbi:hypothetical protein ACQCVE_15625 [Metabacillus sp. 113a]|uniref:hypothetical protein n=1 Tax=Metabacillus sp. 113a TaxID=3404706 RepID=UPI003CEF483F